MKLILTVLLSLFSIILIAQTTFPWNGTYGGAGVNRTYTTTVSGITMSATIVNSENTWQDASPVWFPTGSVNPGGGCSGISATNQGMLLSTDWTSNATKTITTTITFSSPVQGPVHFYLYDINDDGFGSWLDKITVAGTNSVAASVNVFKVGTACVQTGGTVTGSGSTLLTFNSGMSSACTCWGNNEINVGTATDCISTITINYKSGNTTYNNPKQYVVISNLTAIIPTSTPPTSITGTSTICTGQSTNLTVVGGNASSQWYTGSCGGTLVGTGTSITVSPATTTTYYVGNAATTCSPVSSCIPVTVTVNPPPIMTSVNAATICSGGNVTIPLTSNFGTSYTWVAANNANTTGESTTSQTTSSLNNTITNNSIIAQTVVYTVTPSAGSCTGTPQTVNVLVNPGNTPTFTAVAPICSGAALAALPTTSNNAINGTWSPAINNTTTTLYTFTPTAGQCATTTTMSITVNSAIIPVFTAVAPICSGAALALLPTTSNNSINGTWSPALNNTTTTIYTFTPTAGQCATVTTLTISVGPPATPTFTAISPICSGDPLAALPTLSNNGFNGTWSPALNNTVTTLYTFTPTAGQCATTTAMTITVNSSATPTFIAIAPICTGDPLAALPVISNNGFNGTWSPALNNTLTTLYTFTPTAGQCATTTTMTITVNSAIIPTFTPVAPICSGAALALLPTTSNNSINGTWSPVLNNTATTIYTFTPTVGQCATTTTLTISVGPPATPAFTAVTAICSGAPLATLPTISNNGFNGTWSPALNNLATTLYTFTPTVGQCATTTTLTISVNPLPIIDAGLDQTVCSGTSVTLSGASGSTYSWNNGISNAIPFTPISTSTYAVSGTSALGCVNTDQVIVTVNPLPIINAGPDVSICSGTTTILTATGGLTYTWDNSVTNTVSFSPLTTATYVVIGTDINGCVNSDQVNVAVNPLPIVSAGPDVPFCTGNQITLSGTGANTYSWDNGVVNGVPFVPIATTIYTVTGTSLAGCVATDMVTATLNQLLPVTFVADVTTGCVPLTVTFTNTTPNSVNCVWTLSDGTILNGCGSVSATFTQGGCYDVTLSSSFANGCSGTFTAFDLVCVDDAPIASFDQSATLISEFDPTIDFTNTSFGASTYSWDFGDNSPTSNEVDPSHDYTNLTSANYQVMLVAYSLNGCSDTAYSNFTFGEELIFYVPNTYTPDDDMYNQVFKPVFTSGFDPYNYNLSIFNRWGELIFESNDVNIGWDGSYGSDGEISLVQDGTYTWKINYKRKINDEHAYAVGHVNVIR